MYKSLFKRIFDILLGLVGCVIFAIAFIFIAPVIFFTDKGSPFYIAERLGKNGKIFKMYKFRSMRVNAPDIRNEDGSTYNGDDDPRVTKIGRIIRKTSIDELPQFINVLKGDMSIIGPRPNLPGGNYEEFPKIQKKRLTVRPGLTGYNQAYFRNSVSTDEKYKNDCYYVDNITFLMDVKIIFATAISVLKHKNIYVIKATEKAKEAVPV